MPDRSTTDDATQGTTLKRFMTERAAFIGVAAVVLGPFAAGLSRSDVSPIGGIAWVAMAMTAIFVSAKVLVGVAS